MHQSSNFNDITGLTHVGVVGFRVCEVMLQLCFRMFSTLTNISSHSDYCVCCRLSCVYILNYSAVTDLEGGRASSSPPLGDGLTLMLNFDQNMVLRIFKMTAVGASHLFSDGAPLRTQLGEPTAPPDTLAGLRDLYF